MISNRWKYDTNKDWEFLAKNFDCVGAELITDKALLSLGIYIMAIEYLEDGHPRFTEVTRNNEDKTGEEEKVETVFAL